MHKPCQARSQEAGPWEGRAIRLPDADWHWWLSVWWLGLGSSLELMTYRESEKGNKRGGRMHMFRPSAFFLGWWEDPYDQCLCEKDCPHLIIYLQIVLILFFVNMSILYKKKKFNSSSHMTTPIHICTGKYMTYIHTHIHAHTYVVLLFMSMQ